MTKIVMMTLVELRALGDQRMTPQAPGDLMGSLELQILWYNDDLISIVKYDVEYHKQMRS